MPTRHRSSSLSSRNPQDAHATPIISTRSRRLKRNEIRRRPRLSTREKVDDVIRYMRQEYNWSTTQFIVHFMTAASEESHAITPEVRRKRFLKQVEEEGLDWITLLQEADICFEASEQQLVCVARREMDELITKSTYFGKWDAFVLPDSVWHNVGW